MKNTYINMFYILSYMYSYRLYIIVIYKIIFEYTYIYIYSYVNYFVFYIYTHFFKYSIYTKYMLYTIDFPKHINIHDLFYIF